MGTVWNRVVDLQSAKEVAGKLGTEDGKTRKEVETGSK